MNGKKLLVASALLAVTVVALALAAVLVDAQLEPTSSLGHRIQATLPKLFQFEQYKRLFGKSYPGLLENARRCKLFFARAIRVFVSGTKYRYRQSPSYLALNHMSDYTPAELEQMHNRVMDSKLAGGQGPGELLATEDQLELGFNDEPLDNQEAVERLRAALEANEGKPEYAQLKRQFDELVAAEGEAQAQAQAQAAAGPGGRLSRRRRDATELRELPAELLINSGAGVELSAAARAKIQPVESNNENYDPPELVSRGMVDQQKKVKHLWYRQDENFDPANYLVNQVASQKNGEGRDKGAAAALEPEGNGLPDAVFVDLRETNCFFLPRSQGGCGSCYAFAAVSLMEYLYCRKTGRLVAFSEQYVMDCGRKYFGEWANGCSGGVTWNMGHFFHNFGLELRKNYPYLAVDNECPYSENTNLETTGYLRMNVKNLLRVHESRWPAMLETKFGHPLTIDVRTPRDFQEYGGGVHGWGCSERNNSHAMVLVGHGRQEGHEYWLVRNSYSVGWGESGHWKLAKSAGCVYSGYGDTFASDDGVRNVLRLKANEDRDRDLIEAHYASNMIKSVGWMSS